MERVRYKPKIGEVCTYDGQKSNIKGKLVICTKIKSSTAVWIKGYYTATNWDTREWDCTTRFLSPYKPQEPDWEV